MFPSLQTRKPKFREGRDSAQGQQLVSGRLRIWAYVWWGKCKGLTFIEHPLCSGGFAHTLTITLHQKCCYPHSGDKGAKTKSWRRLARGHTGDRAKDETLTPLNTKPRVSEGHPARSLPGTGPAAWYTLSPRPPKGSRHYWTHSTDEISEAQEVSH